MYPGKPEREWEGRKSERKQKREEEKRKKETKISNIEKWQEWTLVDHKRRSNNASQSDTFLLLHTCKCS